MGNRAQQRRASEHRRRGAGEGRAGRVGGCGRGVRGGGGGHRQGGGRGGGRQLQTFPSLLLNMIYVSKTVMVSIKFYLFRLSSENRAQNYSVQLGDSLFPKQKDIDHT